MRLVPSLLVVRGIARTRAQARASIIRDTVIVIEQLDRDTHCTLIQQSQYSENQCSSVLLLSIALH